MRTVWQGVAALGAGMIGAGPEERMGLVSTETVENLLHTAVSTIGDAVVAEAVKLLRNPQHVVVCGPLEREELRTRRRRGITAAT